MKSTVAALAAGLLFGTGLGLSGMTQPLRVIAFLDVAGAWDPSLMFVMLGAIGVHFLLARSIRRRERPLLDTRFHLPSATRVDGALIAGAAVFGIGWGLGGFCPGPAIVSLGSGSLSAFVFVGAMALGMVIAQVVRIPKRASVEAEGGEGLSRVALSRE
ncbi:MAG TPA: YeeE/YedE family protein [Polyangiaceae bacterium]|jgi:uncharacterized membrane protein YedE/YeeE|nr:YeeE/YedE family protein [Polyangiaceae bacterium]